MNHLAYLITNNNLLYIYSQVDITNYLNRWSMPESASHQSETNEAIRSLAIQGLDYLDTRTDFWQQQQPLYSRKRDSKMRENTRDSENAQKSTDPTKRALNDLEKIDEGE